MNRIDRLTAILIHLQSKKIVKAEEMADRIGVISKGEIILVEDKAALMRKLGKKQLVLHLQTKLDSIPAELARYHLDLSADGNELVYTFDAQRDPLRGRTERRRRRDGRGGGAAVRRPLWHRRETSGDSAWHAGYQPAR